ncbi:MAG: prephenate dehydrogenase/arogenate dehydrogenase family protein [Actinobacteria bacterium]|nr:prephenate dehydrogenase/arogenate dehydrogenase family protein [Actinomycetota bacterium]
MTRPRREPGVDASPGASLPTLGLVGLGLIGGSVARRWRAEGGEVVGYARSTATRAGAGRAGVWLADSVAEVVGAADIVVLAVPLPALAEVLDQVALAVSELDDTPTITDVGSVKGPIALRARRVLPQPSVFVPGHPMAGTEDAGWEASDEALFEATTWALAVDEPVDLDRWVAVARLVLALGARVVPVAVHDHDEAVALTSHLPHVFAAELAGRVAGEPLAAALAGGSFRDATRVVRGTASGLGAELVWANRGDVAERLDGLVADLAGLRDALRADDEGAVRALFAAPAGAGVDASGVDASGVDATGVDATGVEASELEPVELPLERGALLALGRRGGRVVGIVERRPGPYAGGGGPAGHHGPADTTVLAAAPRAVR